MPKTLIPLGRIEKIAPGIREAIRGCLAEAGLVGAHADEAVATIVEIAAQATESAQHHHRAPVKETRRELESILVSADHFHGVLKGVSPEAWACSLDFPHGEIRRLLSDHRSKLLRAIDESKGKSGAATKWHAATWARRFLEAWKRAAGELPSANSEILTHLNQAMKAAGQPMDVVVMSISASQFRRQRLALQRESHSQSQ
jgi:hypothetical protein